MGLVIRGIDNRCSLVKSFQGEGRFVGERIVILRFMGCNLACDWITADGNRALCDTAWTWNGTAKGDDWEVDDLVKKILKESKAKLGPATWEKGFSAKERAKFVMVTGGEPMLRQGQEAFQDLIEKIRAGGLEVHIETNGTQVPNEWARDNIDVFVVSPKYQLYPEKYTREMIAEWQKQDAPVVWKFVVGRMADMYDLKLWLENMEVSKDADIYLMPLTKNDLDMGQAEEILRQGAVPAFETLGFKNVRISERRQVKGKFA